MGEYGGIKGISNKEEFPSESSESESDGEGGSEVSESLNPFAGIFKE